MSTTTRTARLRLRYESRTETCCPVGCAGVGKDTPATETLGEGTVSRTASFSWVGGWVVGVGGRWGGGGGEVVVGGGGRGGGDKGWN